MAITVDSTDIVLGGIGGHAHAKVVKLDLGTYATGGVAITAAILGVGKIVSILPFPAGGFTPEYDAAAGKIKAFWVDTTVDGAAQAEVTTATDLGAASFPALVIYRP